MYSVFFVTSTACDQSEKVDVWKYRDARKNPTQILFSLSLIYFLYILLYLKPTPIIQILYSPISSGLDSKGAKSFTALHKHYNIKINASKAYFRHFTRTVTNTYLTQVIKNIRTKTKVRYLGTNSDFMLQAYANINLLP